MPVTGGSADSLKRRRVKPPKSRSPNLPSDKTAPTRAAERQAGRRAAGKMNLTQPGQPKRGTTPAKNYVPSKPPKVPNAAVLKKAQAQGVMGTPRQRLAIHQSNVLARRVKRLQDAGLSRQQALDAIFGQGTSRDALKEHGQDIPGFIPKALDWAANTTIAHLDPGAGTGIPKEARIRVPVTPLDVATAIPAARVAAMGVRGAARLAKGAAPGLRAVGGDLTRATGVGAAKRLSERRAAQFAVTPNRASKLTVAGRAASRAAWGKGGRPSGVLHTLARTPRAAAVTGYGAALPLAATHQGGSLPAGVARLPLAAPLAAWQGVKHPGATVAGFQQALIGIPVGLAYAAAHPEKALKMMRDDWVHRYGPLYRGDYAKFNKIAAETGLTPYALDAIGFGGGASQVIGRLGGHGAFGKAFQGWLTRARPELALAGDQIPQHISRGVLGRGGQHFLDFARKRRDASLFGRAPAGAVRPFSKHLEVRKIGRLLARNQAQSGIWAQHRYANAIRPLLYARGAIRGIPRKMIDPVLKFVTEHGINDAESYSRLATLYHNLSHRERLHAGYDGSTAELHDMVQIAKHPEWFTPEVRHAADVARQTGKDLAAIDPGFSEAVAQNRQWAPLAMTLRHLDEHPEDLAPEGGGGGGPGPEPQGPRPTDLTGSQSFQNFRRTLDEWDRQNAAEATAAGVHNLATPEDMFPGLRKPGDAPLSDIQAAAAGGQQAGGRGPAYIAGTGEPVHPSDIPSAVIPNIEQLGPHRFEPLHLNESDVNRYGDIGTQAGGVTTPGQPGFEREQVFVDRAKQIAADVGEEFTPEMEQAVRNFYRETSQQIDAQTQAGAASHATPDPGRSADVEAYLAEDHHAYTEDQVREFIRNTFESDSPEFADPMSQDSANVLRDYLADALDSPDFQQTVFAEELGYAIRGIEDHLDARAQATAAGEGVTSEAARQPGGFDATAQDIQNLPETATRATPESPGPVSDDEAHTAAMDALRTLSHDDQHIPQYRDVQAALNEFMDGSLSAEGLMNRVTAAEDALRSGFDAQVNEARRANRPAPRPGGPGNPHPLAQDEHGNLYDPTLPQPGPNDHWTPEWAAQQDHLNSPENLKTLSDQELRTQKDYLESQREERVNHNQDTDDIDEYLYDVIGEQARRAQNMPLRDAQGNEIPSDQRGDRLNEPGNARQQTDSLHAELGQRGHTELQRGLEDLQRQHAAGRIDGQELRYQASLIERQSNDRLAHDANTGDVARRGHAENFFNIDPAHEGMPDWYDDAGHITKNGFDEAAFRGDEVPLGLIDWGKTLREFSDQQPAVYIPSLMTRSPESLSRAEEGLVSAIRRESKAQIDQMPVDKDGNVTLWRKGDVHPDEATHFATTESHAASMAGDEPVVKYKVPKSQVRFHSKAFPDIWNRESQLKEPDIIATASKDQIPEKPPEGGGEQPPAPPGNTGGGGGGGVPPLQHGGTSGPGNEGFNPLPDTPEGWAAVKARAEAAGLVEPGYWASQFSPKLRQKASWRHQLQVTGGTLKYTGAVYRLGKEDASIERLLGAYKRSPKRAADWNRAADEIAKYDMGYHANSTRLIEELTHDGVNPDDVSVVNEALLRTLQEDPDHNFATALDEATWAPGRVPEAFYRDRGLRVLPKAVVDSLSDVPGSRVGRNPGGVRRASAFLKTKASRVILGSANLPWLQFQILSNVAMTGLARTGPMDIARSIAWWHGLADDEKRAIEPFLGQGHFTWETTTPQVWHENTRNQLVLAYRALKQARVRIPGTNRHAQLHHANPFNWMFRGDRAQNQFFRKAVLYSQVRRDAYHRLGQSGGRVMAAQERVIQQLSAGPKEQMAAVLRDKTAMQNHAEHVNEFLGDYLTFSPVERNVLASNVMFYAFLRYSLRLVFYTMPVRHPVTTAILGKLGLWDPQEAKKLLGPGALPYMLGAFYTKKDGSMAVDFSRANPALSALTQNSSLLGEISSLLPPHYTLALNNIFRQEMFSGKGLKLGTSSKTLANTDSFPLPERTLVAAHDFLRLYYPYRVVEKIMAGGRPIASDSLLLRPQYTSYKKPGITGSITKSRAQQAGRGLGRQILQEVVIGVPRPSPNVGVAKGRVKPKPGGRTNLPGFPSGGGALPGFKSQGGAIPGFNK